MIDLKTKKWETLPEMNDNRKYLLNQVVFIDGFAYVPAGESGLKTEKFDYKQKRWIPLPNQPIEDVMCAWSCALTYIPQKIE